MSVGSHITQAEADIQYLSKNLLRCEHALNEITKEHDGLIAQQEATEARLNVLRPVVSSMMYYIDILREKIYERQEYLRSEES